MLHLIKIAHSENLRGLGLQKARDSNNALLCNKYGRFECRVILGTSISSLNTGLNMALCVHINDFHISIKGIINDGNCDLNFLYTSILESVKFDISINPVTLKPQILFILIDLLFIFVYE